MNLKVLLASIIVSLIGQSAMASEFSDAELRALAGLAPAPETPTLEAKLNADKLSASPALVQSDLPDEDYAPSLSKDERASIASRLDQMAAKWGGDDDEAAWVAGLRGASTPSLQVGLLAAPRPGSELIAKGVDYLGVKYRYGGNTPESGLDCSGFVRLAVQKSLGLSLPRTAIEQSRMGAEVDMNSVQPGDLVFFGKSRVNHVGVYMGAGLFVHAPRTGQKIRVDDLRSNFWTKTFSGARRISSGI